MEIFGMWILTDLKNKTTKNKNKIRKSLQVQGFFCIFVLTKQNNKDMKNLTIELAKEHLLNSKKVKIGSSLESCIERSEEYANDAINRLIKHYFVNWDFLLNGYNKKEYQTIIDAIIVPYISKHFNDCFEITNNVLRIKPTLYEHNTLDIINNRFILDNGTTELKNEFYEFLKDREIDLILI